jgi:hypothetical protein
VKAEDGVCAVPLVVVPEGLRGAIVLGRPEAVALHDPTVKALIGMGVFVSLLNCQWSLSASAGTPVGMTSLDGDNGATVVSCGHSDAPNIANSGNSSQHSCRTRSVQISGDIETKLSVWSMARFRIR